MISTFAEAERALEPYILNNSGLGAYTVERPQRLAEFVGHPEKKLRVIHVAGTSGKTSTCYYIRALLEAAGQKTGLAVSPHIVNIADRVQIGGAGLGEAEFCGYLDEFLRLIENYADTPSYFEVMMVFAFWVFAREEVDYAVVETGLGGLRDVTNICRRADKVCVLTDIGFDHMNVLGNSLTEIATQKAGIVHPSNLLLMFAQSPEVMAAVRRTARAGKIELLEPPETEDFRERNFALARGVYARLAARDDLPELSEAVASSCQSVQVPGRLDVSRRDEATIVLDGAHNRQKMEALVRAFAAKFPEVKPVVVLAMKQGKEYEEVIRLLEPLASRVIATEFRTMQDTPMGAIAAEVLAAECERRGLSVEIEKDILKAVERAFEIGDAVLVTGSLYGVAEVRGELT